MRSGTLWRLRDSMQSCRSLDHVTGIGMFVPVLDDGDPSSDSRVHNVDEVFVSEDGRCRVRDKVEPQVELLLAARGSHPCCYCQLSWYVICLLSVGFN